jgi:hypothetical protein
VSNHRMDVEVLKDLGKTVFTCVTCHRQVEVSINDGALKVLNRGDTSVLHRAGSFGSGARLADEIETEVEAETGSGWAPGRSLH